MQIINKNYNQLMIAGEVRGAGIVDLISFILQKGKTGILHVENGVIEGQIHICDWMVTGAITGNYSGKDAFFEIFIADSLRFRFEETSKTIKNIDLSFRELIHESSQGTLRQTVNTTDIIKPVKGLNPDQISDLYKRKIVIDSKNGEFLLNLLKNDDSSRAEIMDMVCELVVESALAISKTESLKSFFLFPKNVPMRLDEKETGLFRLIYAGMPVADLIEKSGLSPKQLGDSITWMTVKNAMTICDQNGRVVEPRIIRQGLMLTRESSFSNLMVITDRSFGSRPGLVKVDQMQLSFWQQAMPGSKVSAIKIEFSSNSLAVTCETGRNLLGRIAVHPQDVERLGLFDGDDVVCTPIDVDM